MRYIILILFSVFVFADESITTIVYDKYNKSGLSSDFDYYTNKVVNDYKEDTGYFDKLLANNGIGAQDQAKEITDKIFSLYSKDLSDFILKVLHSEDIYQIIKNNYDEYIKKGSYLINQEIGDKYSDKFYDIYNSNNLNVMLKQDIMNRIDEVRNNILKQLQANVVDGQVTLGDILITSVIAGYIVKHIQRRIGSILLRRLAARAVPVIGWALAAYSLLTVDELYDEIGQETKKVFHQNEKVLVDNISKQFLDLDMISISYKKDIADLVNDFTTKVTGIQTHFYNNPKLENEILNLDNYRFVAFLDSFYFMPDDETYDYLSKKFFKLEDANSIERFTEGVQSDEYLFDLDNLKYLENKANLDISDIFYFKKLLENISTFEIDEILEFCKKHQIAITEDNLKKIIPVYINLLQRDKMDKLATGLYGDKFVNFVSDIYSNHLEEFYFAPNFLINHIDILPPEYRKYVIVGYMFIYKNRWAILIALSLILIFFFMGQLLGSALANKQAEYIENENKESENKESENKESENKESENKESENLPAESKELTNKEKK